MPEIIPFINTRFNPNEAPNLGDVVTPPYDDITVDIQKECYDRHPYNLIRIVQGRKKAGDDNENNKYTRAANAYTEWKAGLALFEEEKASYKVVEQDYTDPYTGERVTRRGFLGLTRVDKYGEGNMRPHLATFNAPKADRYRLFCAVQANICPVTALYRGASDACSKSLVKAAKDQPEIQFSGEDGVETRVWTMGNSSQIQNLRSVMESAQLTLMDGHHRYEAAMRFKIEMHRRLPNADNHQPFDFILTYFIDADREPVCVLPSHRGLCHDLGDGVDIDEFIEDLRYDFDVETFKVDPKKPEDARKEIDARLAKLPDDRPTVAALMNGGRCVTMALKNDADLDEILDESIDARLKPYPATLVHHHIIPNVWIGNPEMELTFRDVLFFRDVPSAIDSVARRKASVVFFLKPLKPQQIVEVSEAGLRLPQKSSFLYPKPPSGLGIHDLHP